MQLRLWAQPTLVGDGRRQVLLSSHDAGGGPGFELALTGEGRFELAVGREAVVLPEPARAGVWCRITAEMDAEGALRLAVRRAHGLPARERIGEEERVERRVGGLDVGFAGPLVMAASAAAVRRGPLGVGDHYNGKLEAPEILAAGAAGDELRRVAGWDLGDGVAGDRAPDRGPSACHARLINGPARAVTGTRWISATTDFSVAPEQYAAVHFHDDDLDDARWTPALRLTLPSSLESGVYAVELRSGALVDHVPLVVSAGARRTARLAVVLPTLTYAAYANERMPDRFDFHADGVREHPVELGEHDRLLARHPEWGRSLYDVHGDGSPVLTASLRRPVPNLRPDYRSWLQDAPRHLGADDARRRQDHSRPPGRRRRAGRHRSDSRAGAASGNRGSAGAPLLGVLRQRVHGAADVAHRRDARGLPEQRHQHQGDAVAAVHVERVPRRLHAVRHVTRGRWSTWCARSRRPAGTACRWTRR